jgi:hypothetical protein
MGVHQVLGSSPKFRGADPAPILAGRRLEMNGGIMFSVTSSKLQLYKDVLQWRNFVFFLRDCNVQIRITSHFHFILY